MPTRSIRPRVAQASRAVAHAHVRVAARAAMVAAVAVTALSAQPLRAQLPRNGVELGVRQAWFSSKLVGAPVGPVLLLRRGGGSTTSWLSAEYLMGHDHRTGVACGGFFLPERCPPQPLRDRTRAFMLAVGFSHPLIRRDRGALELVGAVRGGDIRSRTRGLETGDEISARKSMLGAEGGLDAVVVPFARWPVALTAGGRFGALSGFGGGIADVYEPFGAMHMTSVQVGVRWLGRRPVAEPWHVPGRRGATIRREEP